MDNKDPKEVVIDEFIGQSIPICLYEIAHEGAKDVGQVLTFYFIIENDLVNDDKQINNFFDLVIKSQKEKEIKILIIYKKAIYNAETISENELLDLLNPILKSESVWKSHALLLMADYFEHNNNFIKSKDFLEEIVNSELVNNEIIIEAERRLKRNFGD